MWALDVRENLQRNKLFTPSDITGTISCSNDFPHVLMFNCNLAAPYPNIHQVENSVKKFLRAPWEVLHFTLAQTENNEIKVSDAQPVPETKADGNPITSDDFNNFILTNDRNTGTNLTQEALSKKPDIFLADHPTWTDLDGNTHTTNFFEDFYRGYDGIKVPIAQLYRNGNLSLPHREKMCRISVKPQCILTHPENDTFYSYDISYEWGFHDYYNQTTNLTYETGSGLWFIEVAAVDDGFDTRARNFAHFYTQFMQRGLHIPFDMSLLPQRRGYDTIRFQVEFMFQFGSLHRQRVLRHMTFKIEDTARASELTVNMLDFAPYKNHKHKFINNTCAEIHSDVFAGNSGRPPSQILTLYADVNSSLQLLKSYFHQKNIEQFPTLRTDLDTYEADLKAAGKLLFAENNKNWEQSEGYLQLKELWPKISVYIDDLHQGGFTNPEQLSEIETFRNNIDFTHTDHIAQRVGIVEDVHSTVKRPLHVEKTKENNEIDLRVSRTIEHNLRPQVPVWAEVVYFAMAAAVLGAIIFILYWTWKK